MERTEIFVFPGELSHTVGQAISVVWVVCGSSKIIWMSYGRGEKAFDRVEIFESEI